MAQPRGIRNCNPGNIRLSGDKWKGLRPRQTDGEFCQFTDMAHGYRALIRAPGRPTASSASSPTWRTATVP